VGGGKKKKGEGKREKGKGKKRGKRRGI